jgi:hypothetical protein
MDVIVTGVVPCGNRAVMIIQRLAGLVDLKPRLERQNTMRRKGTAIAFFCKCSKNPVSQAFLTYQTRVTFCSWIRLDR